MATELKKTLVLWMLLPTVLWAGERSATEAAALAAAFMNNLQTESSVRKINHAASSYRLGHTCKKLGNDATAYYVLNSDQGGFVVVSGDDRTEDILMYSDEGELDWATTNPNLLFWLKRMQEQISAVNDENAADKSARGATQVTDIEPLLGDITWSQETPYNDLCPIDPLDDTRSYTGCVATAAAQVMRYWSYPASGTGSHTYTCEFIDPDSYDSKTDTYKVVGQKQLTANFGSTTYDWVNMRDSYYGMSYTTDQAKAVATLMYHCGVACEMGYGGKTKQGSGASSHKMALGLRDYFDYNVGYFISQLDERYYRGVDLPTILEAPIRTFETYFNQDLEAGRPIMMSGHSDVSGGHEFVCDGRDKNGLFHINWGWEGYCNCYCRLSYLKPEYETSDFSNYLDAIVGLEPAHHKDIYLSSCQIVYLGTYYSTYEQIDYPAWLLRIKDDYGNAVDVNFLGYSSQFIEGYYNEVDAIVQLANGDSILASGNLRIQFEGTGTSTSPTYRISAELVSDADKTYTITISGEHAFDNYIKGNLAWDYGYYLLYEDAKTACDNQSKDCDKVSEYENKIYITLYDSIVTTLSDTSLTLTNSVRQYYTNTSGCWNIYGEGDNAIVSLVLYTMDYDSLVGQYDETAFNRGRTKLYLINGDTTAVDIYQLQSLQVTQSNDSTLYLLELLARDGVEYAIHMHYVQPTGLDTVYATVIGNYNDYIKNDGWMRATGTSGDTLFASYAVNTSSITGTYTTKHRYENGSYDYIALKSGEKIVYYAANIDTIVVKKTSGDMAQNYDYVANITYLGQNTEDVHDMKWFKITMNLISFYRYDATVAVTKIFENGRDSIAFDTQYADSGYVVVEALNESKNAYFHGICYVDYVDPVYTIPLGTYPVSDSKQSGTMLMSSGYNYLHESNSPTFYATLKNKLYEKTWYVVDGNLEVTEDQITLQGHNSNGKSVKIILLMTSTDLKEKDYQPTGRQFAPYTKIVKDGQLMILGKDKVFTPTGILLQHQQVK